jgi:hypothetical protein
MTTTQSPSGLHPTHYFLASVAVPAGSSYQDALYAHRNSEAALEENTRALIAAITALHKEAKKQAVSRPVSWMTLAGEKLPTDLRRLVKAIVSQGSQGPDEQEFMVSWTDSNKDEYSVLFDLGDYFWFVGAPSSSQNGKKRHGGRVAIAQRVIDAHFASVRGKRK